MADIFDEISDDLRAERMQNLLRRYGMLLVLAAVLAIAAVAGWQFWRSRQSQQTDHVAATFMDAAHKAEGPATADAAAPGRLDAASAFDELARTAPAGYATLSRLRAAALRAAAGDTPAAFQLWDQISADANADPLLRDLAALTWVQHQIDQAPPDALEARLAPLVAAGNAWRPLAQEQQALLAIRTGQDARARDILKALQSDPASPEGVRNRAGGLLSRTTPADVPAPDIAPADAAKTPGARTPGAGG